ncbi:UvrD-helicase domain-containing protein [Pseudomonas aeruginosa]|uniref:UvrD-helicase domain-containing protein n=1 Tax=Pseudomonas aeruginosa TaxID=287 RepID=UPI0015C40852|nr:UvrD-helicase domain-containing protein [Pseudomonas aeruginosa]QLF20656.1 AAA family ATPase [Pseudomonas aeruginosa]
MKWGSTNAGELFTRCNRWVAEVSGDHLTLSIQGQAKISIHLLRLRSVRVSKGVMWATCHFDLTVRDGISGQSVDGIPNDQAEEMARCVTDAVVNTLIEVVAANAQALESWLSKAWKKLKVEPGLMVDEEEIVRALASVKAPATPGGISWDAILEHEHARAASKKSKSWPSWNAPRIELARRLEAHNAAAFRSSYDRWLMTVFADVDTTRWIPSGDLARLLARYPAPEWPGKTWMQVVKDASPEATLRKLFADHNDKHLARQRVAEKHFFDTVEKNPLTDEQIHACVCMDDSVMVVAAAGSGKTSTMVAKTGYVIRQGLATPDQILLLSFNVSTANEIGKRVLEQLSDVADIEKVKSKTFHAFGSEVIGTATKKKPALAPWVDPSKSGADLREVGDIIDVLSSKSRKFKRDWDLFSTIYARDVGKRGAFQEPDAYANGKRGFLTAKGDIVKSTEERLIADWLFYNGITYEYERTYEHDTATQEYRQYHPDFFYPGIGLYHEHFALNEKGEAPKEFKNYLAGVTWKRKIHEELGTQLIETTSHGLMTGEAIAFLEKELVQRGIKPTFDPTREALGLQPVPNQDLARTFRIFQQHVKNNGLSKAKLRSALKKQAVEGYEARLRMFLSLYEQISAEWERRLQDGHYVDFEDMLVEAAEHVETGRFRSPYSVILADEFQDSSRARVRLLKALAKNPTLNTHLCVVGDDWQGINRFAGSDISVMTEFEKTFEHATRLTLNTTFRCPQDICVVSSRFIQENPVQIRKEVKTTNPLTKTPLLAYSFERRESIAPYVESQLAQMHRAAEAGKLVPAEGAHVTVMLLGRYRDDMPSALGQWQKQFRDRLKIVFKTVHGAKGAEAEYVFVLNMLQGTRGFPSQIQDDPALQMAMPAPDSYPFAEERRLFYVAMTRARKQVRFYTTLAQPSQFLVELVKNQHLKIETVEGVQLDPCPQCEQGVLILRSGKRGSFKGCSRFPACDFTRDVSKSDGIAPSHIEGDSQRIRGTVKAGDQCPVCRRGVIQQKNGRNGVFLACTNYPRCKATASIK